MIWGRWSNWWTDAYQAGYDSLAVVANSFSEQIIAAQGANSQMEDFTLVYLEPTGMVDEQEAALEDLALITGGLVLRTITGHSLGAIKRERCWERPNWPGWITIASESSPAAGDRGRLFQSEIDTLEARYNRSDDERRQVVLRARIGRLRGGSAVIYAAGSSESEMRYQTELITRTIAAMRSALLQGDAARRRYCIAALCRAAARNLRCER